MKKLVVTTALLAFSQSVAAFAGVNVDIHVGVPPLPPPVVVAPVPPPPVYAPPPVVVQQPPEVVYEAQPRFVFVPTLGFYVSVGVPYDICYIGNNYYYRANGTWYVGPSYSGPWAVAQPRYLPNPLLRYRYDQIRSFRDREYRVYQRSPEHYRGRVFHPIWNAREHMRDTRERFRERRDERR